MSNYRSIRQELERMLDAASASAQEDYPGVILYHADQVREEIAQEIGPDGSEQERERVRERIFAELRQQAEQEALAKSPRLRSRKKKQADDTGAILYFPIKGSVLIEETDYDS